MQVAQSNTLLSFVISIVFFIIGYVVVSKLLDYFRKQNINSTKTGEDENKSEEKNHRNESDRAYNQKGQDENKDQNISPEKKYRSVFGFNGPVSREDIKKRYRELILKYHPDKVQHLGEEFQKIAEEKTKMIHEAYDYFRKTYGIKD